MEGVEFGAENNGEESGVGREEEHDDGNKCSIGRAYSDGQDHGRSQRQQQQPSMGRHCLTGKFSSQVE